MHARVAILLIILVTFSNMGANGFLKKIIKKVVEIIEDTVEKRLLMYYDQLDILDLPFTLSENASDVRFLLVDKANFNESHELRVDKPETFLESTFDPEKPTIVIIHGFWTNSKSRMPTTLKQAFVNANSTSNIILVDWGRLSTPVPKNFHWPFAYVMVVKNSRVIVSDRIAEFLRFMMVSNYTKVEELHIIAHSMGAHIAGRVGYLVSSMPEAGGKKIGRLSALDPAGPMFNFFLVNEKVSREDATFVDIYHSAAGSLGIAFFSDGHVNFLLNGGYHQPGCVDPKNVFFGEAKFGSCSHNYVTKLFAASITKDIKACECSSRQATNFDCPVKCKRSVLVGYRCPLSAKGQYYLETPEDIYPG